MMISKEKSSTNCNILRRWEFWNLRKNKLWLNIGPNSPKNQRKLMERQLHQVWMQRNWETSLHLSIKSINPSTSSLRRAQETMTTTIWLPRRVSVRTKDSMDQIINFSIPTAFDCNLYFILIFNKIEKITNVPAILSYQNWLIDSQIFFGEILLAMTS